MTYSYFRPKPPVTDPSARFRHTYAKTKLYIYPLPHGDEKREREWTTGLRTLRQDLSLLNMALGALA